MVQFLKKTVKEELFVTIFVFLCTLLFAVLFCFSFGMTWENREITDEFVYFKSDSLLGNAAGLLLSVPVLFGLLKLKERIRGGINKSLLVGLVCLLSAAFGIYWVYATKTVPQSDQALVCGYASLFNMGDVTGLMQGEYVGRYQYQLGLITFMRVLFKIFGDQQFQVYQYFSALMLPVIIFSGYKITGLLSHCDSTAQMYYILAMIFCVPMYGYVPFVYGEISATAFAFLAVWMFLECRRNLRWWKLSVLGLAIGASVQFRQSMQIVAIAMLIVTAVGLFRKENRRAGLLTACGILAGVLLGYGLIGAIYSKYIPKNSKSTPSSLFLAMGTNDSSGMAGWHNGYDHHMYALHGYDPEKAGAAAWADVGAFAEKCLEDPGYALDFYYRKCNAQWNSPMYQCLAMNNKIEGEQTKLAASVYFGGLRKPVEAFMNLYQLLLYGGVLLFLVMRGRNGKYIDRYVLLIAVYGGFLLSMIWEAKPRYVFPYFLMMIPCAAVGAAGLVKKVEQWVTKRRSARV